VFKRRLSDKNANEAQLGAARLAPMRKSRSRVWRRQSGSAKILFAPLRDLPKRPLQKMTETAADPEEHEGMRPEGLDPP
jgi:hypothetical protein